MENSPRSPSPQPPTPAPRTRRIYHTTADIATRSADVTQSTPSAPHHTPAEDTPLLAQVPRIHVMPQQVCPPVQENVHHKAQIVIDSSVFVNFAKKESKPILLPNHNICVIRKKKLSAIELTKLITSIAFHVL